MLRPKNFDLSRTFSVTKFALYVITSATTTSNPILGSLEKI